MVRNGRPESGELEEVRSQVAWGPGPRASQALMLAVRARALIDGRLAPSIEDVLALAHPVLKHRMALSFAARADGVTPDHIIAPLTAPYQCLPRGVPPADDAPPSPAPPRPPTGGPTPARPVG